MNRAVWIVCVTLSLAVPGTVVAYDFMERPVAVLPGPPPAGAGVQFARGGYAHAAYRANQFANTRLDQFQVEGYGNHTIVDIGSFRTGIFYGTYMLNGPVTEDDNPGAEAAQWMMNAIQYEYGLVWSWDIAMANMRLRPLFEYSRRSYHPVRGGFSEPAADLIRIGVALQQLETGISGVRFDVMTRIGWTELYEFWGAPRIPAPRALYTLHTAIDVRYRLTESLSLFGVVTPDLIVLRAGGLAIDGAFQAGVRLGRGPSWLELYLDGFTTGDTEQLRDEATPANLLGYGVRFVIELESPDK